MNTSTKEYTTLEKAYNHFNKKLFKRELPDCIITLQRKSKSRGYFHAMKFSARSEKKAIDELALNPDTFIGRKDIEILSTLTHEMVHVWQQHKGTPPRKAYHNKEWAEKMENIGLMPSDTGEPEGKKTGQNMTHYIIKNGIFEKECKTFLETNQINWQSRPDAKKDKKTASKIKYTCEECNQNAWAKPNANLICGICEVHMYENV